jgi:hypothetical protein
MADAESKGKDEGKTEGGETKTLTLGDLRKFIQDEIGGLVKSGKAGRSSEDDAHDEGDGKNKSKGIADEVAREIERIKSKEAKDHRDKTIDEKLKELGEKTAEKAPVERRKVHRFMGWGE